MATNNISSVLKGTEYCEMRMLLKKNTSIVCCLWLVNVYTDVVAYVDVWSGEKTANYSDVFIQQLEKMGAQVSTFTFCCFFMLMVFVMYSIWLLLFYMKLPFSTRYQKDSTNKSHTLCSTTVIQPHGVKPRAVMSSLSLFFGWAGENSVKYSLFSSFRPVLLWGKMNGRF